MALIQFNCDGRMADIGKAGEQFDHKKGETIEVSAECAQAAVGYKMAGHVQSESKPAADKKKSGKSGPKPKSESKPAQKDKEAAES